MMPLVHSIRVRLALWHALALAATLLVFAAGTWVFLRATLRLRAGEAMTRLSAELEASWREDIAEEGTAPIAAVRAAIGEYRARDTRLLVYDSAGALIAVSDSAPL